MLSILVIDDEKDLLDIIKQTLAKYNHIIETAYNGKEGIEKFDNGYYDLVITDLQMPEADGNQVLSHIRKYSKDYTPVIGISGTPWLLDSNEFDLIIPKPFRFGELVNAVEYINILLDNRCLDLIKLRV